MAVTRTPKIGLEIAPYEEPRIDLIHTRNWEKLDELQCICPALAETLSSTAPVDVFIYDTTKDSDGGVWRNGQPVVMAIVAETTKISVFDLTDPSAPLFVEYVDAGITSVFVLNGQIIWGTATGVRGKNLITDEDIEYTTLTTPAIVNNSVNQVAMTIIDNAPIDSETGIAVPTIAVATDGGMSVIDGPAGVGTVVDISATTFTHVGFDADNKVILGKATVTKEAATGVLPVIDIAWADYRNLPTTLYLWYTSASAHSKPSLMADTGQQGVVVGAFAQSNGLTRLYEDTDTPANGMVDYTTKDYFSGIMQGDIQMAALADTVAGDIPQYITDGAFPDATNWNVGANWAITGGKAVLTGSSAYEPLYQDLVIDSLEKTTLTFDVDSISGEGRVELSGNATQTFNFNTTGKQTIEFTPDRTALRVVFVRSTNPTSMTIDNVSISSIADRCVKDNPLNVIGTITKTPIATGAELVAYSGFSATDYIEQAYNSDLDFGTSDLYIMGWVKTTLNSATQRFVDRTSANQSRFGLYTGSSGNLYIQTRASSVNSLTGGSIIKEGLWTFVCGVVSQSGTNHKLYQDGSLDAEATVVARNISDPTATLRIGLGYNDIDFCNGSLALFRVGAGAPTDAQILEIYNTEKELFKEGAKCTLQGTSSDVKALSYNPDTEQLLVGTGSGSTRFNGLVAYQEELNITESDGTITTTTDDDYTSISSALDFMLHGVTTGSFANSEQSNVQERLIELEEGKVDTAVFDPVTKYNTELQKLMDGFVFEKIELYPLIVVGDKVYQDIRAEGGGDIHFVTGNETMTLDCTTGVGVGGRARVELAQGVEGVDQWSITFMAWSEQEGKAVLFNSTAIPHNGFAPASYNSIESYTEVTAIGPIVFQRVTDVMGDDFRGALSYSRENIRLAKRNNRIVGIDGDLEITTVSGLPDKIRLSFTPGTAYQMHRQIVPAYDTDVMGVFACGCNTDGTIRTNQKLDHIGQMTETALGVPLLNGDVIIMDVFMNINSLDGDKKLFIIPDTHAFAAAEDQARLVSRNARNKKLPQNSDSVGIFLYRLVLKYTTTDGGTWENLLTGKQEVWTNVATSITSPDWPSNYPNGYPETQQGIVTPGAPAEAIRFNFSEFNTEQGYDLVYTKDSTLATVQTIHGNLGALQSNPVAGTSASVWFESDSNVNRDGFEITSYDWLETVTSGKEMISLK